MYNFNKNCLFDNIRKTVEFYNDHVSKWMNNSKNINIDDFVISDYEKINWSESLKNYLTQKVSVQFDEDNLRISMYRPFTK